MILQENTYYVSTENPDNVFHTIRINPTITKGQIMLAEFANSGQIIPVYQYIDDASVEECGIQKFIDVAKKYGIDLVGLYQQ